MCLSLSFPLTGTASKILLRFFNLGFYIIWRNFERGGRTSDARKNAATVRQQRATGVRRETTRQSRGGGGEERARKRAKEREKNKEAFFPFYTSNGLDIIR